METFAVAMACQPTATPLTVVRGLSNLVGRRDPAQWCLREALASTADLLQHVIDRAD
jgi:nucleoside phosphorylase